MIPGGDQNGINVGAGEQFEHVPIHPAIRVAITGIDHLLDLLAPAAGRIADRHELNILFGEHHAQVVLAARTEANIRSRGRGYVLRRLQSIGIGPELAKEAVDEVYGALDETALLERALTRRMRGRNARVHDQAQFRRLLNQLVRQGFQPSAVITALKARSRRDAVADDDPDV